MKRLFGKVLATLALVTAGPAAAQAVDTGHLVAELVARDASVAPGSTTYVAIRQKIDDGWHTYWRNPGDSGEPTRATWTLPAGWTAGEIVWPTPERQVIEPLVNYGYEGEVLLPVPVTAPADARPGESITLKAHVTFLVCEKICIPEEANLSLTLPVAEGLAQPHPRWGEPVAETLAAAPAPAGFEARFSREGEAIKLAITGPALRGADMSEAYFFPFDGAAIEHAKPQAIERGPDGLTLTLAPGYGFQAPEPPKSLAGVLSLGERAYEISAAEGPAPAGAAGLGPPPAPRGGGPAGADLGLLAAAAFAFLGGLILNLMPCVFPILAMKAASLAGHAHERAAARGQAVAFTLGVLATFLALAGALIGLRAGGAAAGWGFQLQSPPVVAGLALLMLAVALNLSGVFHVGTSLQGAGSSLAGRRGLAGAFFTGALAVVVAAPCTAPFMAPALGWALTQEPPAALAVFLALGLGFALPFAAVAFAPGLLSRLPKPGPWMDGLKKFLAFPMYGAAAWLVWVLTVQAGPEALARLFAAAVVLALAAWLLGIAQQRRAAGGRPMALVATGAALTIAAALAAVWPSYQSAGVAPASASAEGATPFEPYSAERLAALQAEGRPVFVNFTAAWCVTCQVNEKVALSRQAVAEAFEETGAAYLKADWTSKDDAIEAELARHGRAGVPLYLVYGAGGGAPEILPQVLTEGMVVKALREAKSS